MLGLGLFLLLLTIGVPIGFSMLIAGFAGIAFAESFQIALRMLQLVPFSTTANYSMIVLPLFLLMGEYASYGGLSRGAYNFMHKALGHIPGGVVMASIGGCAAFAAVCGSSMATAVTMGTVAIPEMIRYKTDRALATGAVAAGGTIGILIPPSIGFIVYAIITENSVGKLFLAGFIPGILMSILFMITIYILTYFNPRLSPPAPRATRQEIFRAFVQTWEILFLFVIVIGGIYLGIFTASEAAGVGALGAFLLSLFKRKLTWQDFWTATLNAGRTTGMVFVIIIGAFMFGYFLTVTGLPAVLSDFVMGLQLNRYTVLMMILVFYVFLGCIMDIVAGMLTTLPIVYPVIQKLGFDPIWFGVVTVIIMEMGMITPPVGLNVFAVAGISGNTPLETVFRGIFPFFIAMIFCLAIIILFPQLSLFLPNLMK
jgi:tripartite ATP-independent transporter DctM subunit